MRSGHAGDYFKEMRLINALKSKMTNTYASDGMFVQIARDERLLTFLAIGSIPRINWLYPTFEASELAGHSGTGS